MILPDLSSSRRSLTETILWCSLQPLRAEGDETAETLRRRQLIVDAGKLFKSARDRNPLRVFWSRESRESAEYTRAMEMLTEADQGTLVSLKDQLRTPAIWTPDPDEPERFSNETWSAQVAEVVSNRSRLLSQPTVDEEALLKSAEGRLLCVIPSESLSCGGARYPSNGFFDDDNFPPWDTWVQFTDGVLLAWVPAILVPLVQDGIDANPEQCIGWAERGRSS